MKTILAIMGIMVAAFLLTTTIENGYALTQTNTQNNKQVAVCEQKNKAGKQAGFIVKQKNDCDIKQKNFQKAENEAKCKWADCDTHVKVIKKKDNRKWDSSVH
jgi:hypothetical protein